MKKLILFTTLIFAMACSSNHSSQTQTDTRHESIIGGALVTSKDTVSKFVVGLYDTRHRFICTGSLIRENIILTAGHCIEAEAANIVIVFDFDFSAFSKNDSAKLRTASAVRVHPHFNEDQNSDMDWNDIALVQFEGQAPEGYAPASFLNDDNLLQRRTKVHMAGYGSTGVELEEVTKRDKKFNRDLANGDIFCSDPYKKSCFRVTFLGRDELRMTDATIEGFTEKEIRLNENKGHGTCVGDSGGPLMLEKDGLLYLVGVTSRGSEICDGPAVYTNALKYQDWIEKTILEIK